MKNGRRDENQNGISYKERVNDRNMLKEKNIKRHKKKDR